MGQGYIAPSIDKDGSPFWEGAQRGELRMQACVQCGRFRFPPRPMCPHCRSTSVVWRAMSGGGRIWSYMLPHPPLLDEFADLPGFNVVVVELDEDPNLRLVGNLVASPDAAINSVDPSEIRIGDAVRAVFPEVEPGVRVLRWLATES